MSRSNPFRKQSRRLTLLAAPGEELALEDIYHLQSLIQKLKMIEKRQAALQEYVDADVQKVVFYFSNVLQQRFGFSCLLRNITVYMIAICRTVIGV